MASNSTCIFPSAAEARHSHLRSKALHEEVRGIEAQVLEAIKLGLFEVTVSNGTPMTNSTPPIVDVWTVDTATDILTVPNHGYQMGDAVTVTSSVSLPSPLRTDAWYYVIYVDEDRIKLSTSYADAVGGRPISLDITAGVTEIILTQQGSNYLQPPSVVLTGGSVIPASARAYLASWGSIARISVISPGSGFGDVPIVNINSPGSGATLGDVTYAVVGATINSPGSGYSIGDVLSVSGGTGTAATAIVTEVNLSGAIQAIILGNPGSYTVLPTIAGTTTTVLPNGGTGATLTLTMGIKAIDVAAGGTGYIASPRIVIDDSVGVGAEATATLIGGSISGITILSQGYGYIGATVSLDSGSGATAIASLVPTSVQSIELTNGGGSHYTSIPSVTLSPIGSGATSGQVTMKVVSCAMTGGGDGYTKDDTLLVAGGTANRNAYIRVLSVDPAGKILTYILEDGGSYTAMPGLINNPVNGGTGRLASFNLSMGVNSVAVSSPGSGYQVPPVVSISAPPSGGDAAAAGSRISTGAVTEIEITASGTGYIFIPTVTISNGSGATAEAILTPTTLGNISVAAGGTGYTSANVVITGGGATLQAAASAVLVGDAVGSITITSPGSGYTSPPTVTIIGDGTGAAASAALTPTSISQILMVDIGSGYVQPPLVDIPGPATASSMLSATGINEIVMTDGGSNYTADPIITLTPGPRQIGIPVSATMTPQRGFSLSRIGLTSTGSGYQSIPTVTIAVPQLPDGDQATAIASIGAGLGTFAVRSYPESRDYFRAWKGQPLSNSQLSRPYAERMETVIAYFTNLGYKINRVVNPSTNNTLMWVLQW